MMGNWGLAPFGWMGMLFMGLISLGVIALIVLGVVWLVRKTGKSTPPSS
jgi:flagellar biogenesis protein FliO